jgi:hypothetical protein
MSAESSHHRAARRVNFFPGKAARQGHDTATKASIAASLAGLLRLPYAGELGSASARYSYLVPSETLVHRDAVLLGISTADDLFGGVVPQAFMASKAITHPLIAVDAPAPDGWEPGFPAQVAKVVLEGYSAFDTPSAREACLRLLRGGEVRVKNAAGVGGAGQAVVTDPSQLDALLASPGFAEPWPHGLVLERNLRDVHTVSIGQVQVGDLLISYHGRQRLTRNHRGDSVYGGSSLHLVRGGFDALLDSALPGELRLAAEQALTYHRTALEIFKGMIVSRSNYDVAQGIDDLGIWRSGVLEQSWRIGGASGAEVAALHAFRDHPARRWVQASTHEIYADDAVAPAGAQVHFCGRDEHVGALLKYSLVEAHGDD